MNPRHDLIEEMAVFNQALIDSEDIDPLYPVLKAREAEMDAESALWYTALYLNLYNIASAERMFCEAPAPRMPPRELIDTIPIDKHQRNYVFDRQRLYNHFEAYLLHSRAFGSQAIFFRSGFGSDPVQNFRVFWNTVSQLPGVGRTSAFKWAEVLKKVHGWNIAAPDMCLQYCSGPKKGLEMIYQHPNAPLKALNSYGDHLMSEMRRRGLELDWEGLETCLCAFYTAKHGSSYVGSDIDEMQEVIEKADLTKEQRQRLFDARRAAIPRAYLGEISGWFGVDKKAMKEFYQAGKIYDRGAA